MTPKNSLKDEPTVLRRTVLVLSSALIALPLLMVSGIQYLGEKLPFHFVQEARASGDGDGDGDGDGTLPLLRSSQSSGNQELVRVINHSKRPGTAQIHATDDSGRRFGPVSLSLEAMATVQFTSRDLEEGNAAKGIPSGLGQGEGNWRLEFDTELDWRRALSAESRGIEVQRTGVGALRGPGVPVVVAGQHDMLPSQR